MTKTTTKPQAAELRAALEGLLPHVEAARLREESQAAANEIQRMPVRSAIRKAHEALASQPTPSAVGEDVRAAFNAGFHAAERGLGFEGCDESGEALEIEWQEYAAALTTTSSPINGEAAQALQDHMEQHHGVVLKASEWDAAIAALAVPAPQPLDATLREKVEDALANAALAQNELIDVQAYTDAILAALAQPQVREGMVLVSRAQLQKIADHDLGMAACIIASKMLSTPADALSDGGGE